MFNHKTHRIKQTTPKLLSSIEYGKVNLKCKQLIAPPVIQHANGQYFRCLQTM